ncbi:Hypothetical protein D9617_4g004410 [Elsinoe fawcettii]|nr:Hypothetical protein D9617_4g004410 [Elsinoe fawcettii]
MRLALLTLPAVAMLAEAASLATSESAAPEPTSDGPSTLENRSATVDAILASMSSQYSRDHPVTTTAKTTTTAISKTTTTAAAAKKSSTKAPKKKKPTKKGKGARKTTKAQKPKKSPSRAQAPTTSSVQVTITPTAVEQSTTITIAPTPSKATKARRQNVNNACAQQPILYTYTPSVPAAAATDVIAPIGAFLRDTNLTTAASSVATIDGFTTIFSGLLGVAQKPLYYMFYTDMSSYNATACGEICKNTDGCRSFNMYFERSPSLAPGSSCPNPTAYTAVRCAYYSTFIKATDVVNSGQWRRDFGVVITGANGYRRIF